MPKSKLIPYELNKEDILQCTRCGELFKVPTVHDECPNCCSPDFQRIDYPNVVMILADTRNLPFRSIRYSNRIKTDRVVDGIYYVLCSKTYSTLNSGMKKYYTVIENQVTFVELDKAIIFTTRGSAFQSLAYSRMLRDAYCAIHKVVVIDKHVVEDLGKTDF